MERNMKKQKELLEEFLNEWHEGNGITAHTSGSTGTPKNITLSQSHVERSALRSNKFFGITSGSRLHAAMSFEFIGGKMMIARSLMARCQLTYSEPAVHLLPPEPGRAVTLLSLVPAQLHYVLENLAKFSEVEQYLVGGSAIDNRLWDKIVSSGLKVWESYGMTETATHIAMRRVAGHSSARPRFVPFPNVKLSTDAFGCLIIQDADVKVATTDLAKIYPDGSFEILGRKDDMIISGGLKVMPQEIERKIQPYISDLVREFYISSVPDEVWTSKIILVAVAPDEYNEGENSECLKDALKERLKRIPEDVMVRRLLPKDVLLVSSLPTTRSGKLNRRFKFSEEG